MATFFFARHFYFLLEEVVSKVFYAPQSTQRTLKKHKIIMFISATSALSAVIMTSATGSQGERARKHLKIAMLIRYA